MGAEVVGNVGIGAGEDMGAEVGEDLGPRFGEGGGAEVCGSRLPHPPAIQGAGGKSLLQRRLLDPLLQGPPHHLFTLQYATPATALPTRTADMQ